MYPVQIRIPSECHKCNVFTNLTSTESEIQKAGKQAMQTPTFKRQDTQGPRNKQQLAK